MKLNSKVTMLMRIKLSPTKQTYAKPAIAGNGRIKPQYAVVSGQEQRHPEAVYYLRFESNGKRQWENVGNDAQLAVTAQRRRELLQGSERLGLTVQSQSALPPVAKRLTVLEAVTEYVAKVQTRKSEKTASRYEYELTTFQQMCPVVHMDEITEPIIHQFMDKLKAKGNAPRTIFNRVCGLITFLRHYKFHSPLQRTDMPRYVEKVAAAYNVETLRVLFAGMTPNDRLAYQFFLNGGGREQEVMYACFPDIDFVSGVWSIRAKADLGFTLKDYEERAVPLADALIEDLKAHKARNPKSRLLFPNASGGVEGHFLRKLKEYALVTGLNCGHCTSRKGLRCDEHPVCKHITLHKFRKTFAFLHHEAGVSARTLMNWLGHSDLETTLSYLQIADVRSAHTRSQVNKSFFALTSA